MSKISYFLSKLCKTQSECRKLIHSCSEREKKIKAERAHGGAEGNPKRDEVLFTFFSCIKVGKKCVEDLTRARPAL